MATSFLLILSTAAFSLVNRLATGLKNLLYCVCGQRTRGEGGPATVNRAVLVTNCDDVGGLGRALVQHLDEQGNVVFASCRHQLAATQIRQSSSPNLKPFVIDVTDYRSISRAVDFVKQCLSPTTVLWAVVNTSAMAGAAGLPAEMHSVDDDYRPLCETNLFGMAAVTSAFMPLLVASRGRVVNTGSLSGIVAIPSNISHVATESAIVAWSEALRREKATFGVSVSTVLVGDNNADAETVWRSLKTRWLKVPDETKLLYEHDYLEKVGYAVWKSIKKRPTDLKPVITAYNKALFDSNQRRFYHVGRDAKMAAALSCLPRAWQDVLFPFVFWYPDPKSTGSRDAANQLS